MADNREWFYSIDGKQSGPVTGAELKQLSAAGTLGAKDLLWKEGMPEWLPVARVKGLAPAPVKRTTPPPLSPESDGEPTSNGVGWLWVSVMLLGAILMGVAFVAPWWGITVTNPEATTRASSEESYKRAIANLNARKAIFKDDGEWHREHLGSRTMTRWEGLNGDPGKVSVIICGFDTAVGIVELLSAIAILTLALLPVFVRLIRGWAWICWGLAALLGAIVSILPAVWAIRAPWESVSEILNQGVIVGPYLALLGNLVVVVGGGLGGIRSFQKWLRDRGAGSQLES